MYIFIIKISEEDIENVKIQEDELEDVKLITFAEFKEIVNNKEKGYKFPQKTEKVIEGLDNM